MIRDGSTPRGNTCEISPFDAQSNPVPRAAKSRRTYGSGLHLIAEHIRSDIRLGAYEMDKEQGVTLTEERCDLGQVPLPSEVLLKNVAEISHEEGLFGIRLPFRSQMQCPHYAVSKMNVGVPAVKEWEPRNR